MIAKMWIYFLGITDKKQPFSFIENHRIGHRKPLLQYYKPTRVQCCSLRILSNNLMSDSMLVFSAVCIAFQRIYLTNKYHRQKSIVRCKETEYTVAYLGGARCDAPLWPDHENFLQATLYEKVRFLPFSSKNCKIQQCLMVFCVFKFQKNGRICGFH